MPADHADTTLAYIILSGSFSFHSIPTISTPAFLSTLRSQRRRLSSRTELSSPVTPTGHPSPLPPISFGGEGGAPILPDTTNSGLSPPSAARATIDLVSFGMKSDDSPLTGSSRHGSKVAPLGPVVFSKSAGEMFDTKYVLNRGVRLIESNTILQPHAVYGE